MKKFLLLLLSLHTMAAALLAQAPEKLSYQAVIRNSANMLVSSQNIGMRISLLQGSATGTVVYAETHSSSTNAGGVVSLEIGGGTVVSGSFSAIDWAAGPYFIKTETDPEGGSNYSITGTSQLLSAPYALYAKTSGSSAPGPQGPAGKNALIRTTPEAAGANCANGGVKIEAGLDADGNGQLGDAEVNASQTKYLCNGAAGATGPQGPAGTSGNGGFVHYVGEQYGGGVVFHVYRDASGTERGLVVALNNQSDFPGVPWSNVIDQQAGATSTWDGLANSNAIVAQAGHDSSAAKLCRDYSAGGFTDWYLPTKNELTLLWGNLFNVEKSLSSINGADQIFPLEGFGIYETLWSSSEPNGSFAWLFSVKGPEGETFNGNKAELHKVRAIRAYAVQPGPVTDVDGNSYETVTIGTQVWMKENLKVSKYRNGDAIPTGLSNTAWQNTSSGACAVYNNDPANENTYGKLYNWYAVADSRGLCPTGWHVPNDAELTTLEDWLLGNGVAGGKMKSTGTIEAGTGLWYYPNTDATNLSGFSGLAGGFRNFDGGYYYLNYWGYWWSSTENLPLAAWSRGLNYALAASFRDYKEKTQGFSVRCLKD
jgi:uncharacterized protein (TIGR02145 family)